VTKSLPSGRHGLPAEYVASHQRTRLLCAVCEVSAERGYDAVTIADVVRAAAVSPRTFYRHFRSKQDCFLVALELALAELEAAVGEAVAACRRDWTRQTAIAVRAAVDQLCAHPVLARTLLVDTLHVGAPALRIREHALARCRESLPLPPGAPPQVVEAAVGGVVETVYHALLEGHADQLADMCGELTYCLLVPLVGHERALTATDGHRAGFGSE
jgi:AcrR family transcriptional regulator